MLRCARCVMPTTRPDVPFVDGVCGACLNYARRPSIDWDARKAELLALLDRFDGRCVVPSSGGKDSHAQVLALKALGADVVTVTAMTCMLTELGRYNLDNLAKYAKGHEDTPHPATRAKLNRLGLELVGDCSWPEHAAIFSMAFRGPMEVGRQLVFMGECPQTEYGGPQGSEDAKRMTHRWIHEFGGFLGVRASDFIGMDGITEDQMRPYAPPSADDVAKAGIEVHFLGSYLPWDSRLNAKLAAEHGMRQELPFEANWWKAENLDSALTGLHDHFGWLKYRYGRGCAQISVDVRAGLIAREVALEWVEAHDGTFPYWYAEVPIVDVLDRIGMSMCQLEECIERFTNKELA